MEGKYPHLQSSSTPPVSHGPSSLVHNSLFQQQQPQMPLQHHQQQLQGLMQPHLHYMQIQKQQLQMFWQQQMHQMEQVAEFKQHQLPLARIKKIMKSDEDVKMISAEAPVLFSKACELFILELTLRSWLHTEENKRRTLQRNDIAGAISRGDVLDFLLDIVPRDEVKDEEYGGHWTGIPPSESMSYGGIHFPLMHAQPYQHNFNPDVMAAQQTMSQQLMSQQPLMPDQPLMYQPPQQ